MGSQPTAPANQPEEVSTVTETGQGVIRRFVATRDIELMLADINFPNGTVIVAADPNARFAAVEVSTGDGVASRAADAVRGTSIVRDGRRVTVVTPRVKPAVQRHSGGGIVNRGNGNVITGNVIGGSSSVAADEGDSADIRCQLVLPVDSEVQYVSQFGSLYTCGHLADVSAFTLHGSIDCTSVGRIDAETGNNLVRIGTVTQAATVDTGNGSVKIRSHKGDALRVVTNNGPVSVTVDRQATGFVRVEAGNGSAMVHGVRDRTDLDVRVTSENGTARTL